MNSTKSPKYSPEVRDRAVRMVFEHRGEHASEWAGMVSIAAKIGCKAETLRLWVRQEQRDQGEVQHDHRRTGTHQSARTRVPRVASCQRNSAQGQRVFCSGGARPPMETMICFVDAYRAKHGVEPICRVIEIAPSTYHAHVARRTRPETASARVRRDAELSREIRAACSMNTPGLRRAQGLAADAAGRPRRGPLHGGAADEENGYARDPRQTVAHNRERQGQALSARSRQSPVQGAAVERAVVVGLRLRRDVDGLRLCRLRHRRLRPPHCRLAGQPLGARWLRARCPRAGDP